MQTEDTTELTAEQIETLIADAPAPNNGGNENGEAEFVPTDAAGVDWVLGKIADARARAQRIRGNAELMARAEERSAEHLEWKYGPNLQTWLRAELAGGKRKSVRLLNGVVGYRQKPAGVCITDPAAALAWVKENATVALIERLDKKALAQVLLENGEVVPFARLEDAEEVFYIK